MPAIATITRDQRAGIYEVVRSHLGALNDIWIAMEIAAQLALLGRFQPGDAG